MKILSKGYDGGKSSGVTGFWLLEIKSLFSIVILKFNKGTRENYHSHAFNAFSWFIRGEVEEEMLDGTSKKWSGLCPVKYTSKGHIHRVRAIKDTYCISVRGPWDETWNEYNKDSRTKYTLTNGRKVVHNELF